MPIALVLSREKIIPVYEFWFVLDLIHAENVAVVYVPCRGVSIFCEEPLKVPPPSICPAAAVAPVIVPLFAPLVESNAVKLVPLGKCQTPLKLLSHTLVAED